LVSRGSRIEDRGSRIEDRGSRIVTTNRSAKPSRPPYGIVCRTPSTAKFEAGRHN
jgi:hypothetical protein